MLGYHLAVGLGQFVGWDPASDTFYV